MVSAHGAPPPRPLVPSPATLQVSQPDAPPGPAQPPPAWPLLWGHRTSPGAAPGSSAPCFPHLQWELGDTPDSARGQRRWSTTCVAPCPVPTDSPLGSGAREHFAKGNHTRSAHLPGKNTSALKSETLPVSAYTTGLLGFLGGRLVGETG